MKNGFKILCVAAIGALCFAGGLQMHDKIYKPTVIYAETPPYKPELLSIISKKQYDSLATAIKNMPWVKPVKENLEVGDTVSVDVIMHGLSVGIIRALRSDVVYVDFFECNCNGWYDIKAFGVRPFSQTWNRINK